MSFDKIMVLGAGAVGSVFGALLSRNNVVELVSRNIKHVEEINSEGLRVEGDVENLFPVKANVEVEDFPGKTLVLVTTKAYSLASAVRGVKDFLGEDSAILVLQNGLGNEKLAAEIVGGRVEVVRGLTSIGAELHAPGRVVYRRGVTVVAQTPVGEEVARLFNKSGLETRLTRRIEEEVWEKLVVNCVVNPLTAILGARNDEIVVEPLKPLRRQLVEECVKVGEAEGHVFEDSLSEILDQRIMGFRNFSSMYQDLRKGKRTEIDFLNGEVVRLGGKHGVPTPANQTLVYLIKFLEGKRCLKR